MIEKYGDLFHTSARMIGQGVNTQGLMGAGIALQFAKRWPEMKREYQDVCEPHRPVHKADLSYMCECGNLSWPCKGFLQWQRLHPGGIHVYRTVGCPIIVNMASQEFPGANARLEWLLESAQKAIIYAEHWGFDTIAIPRIGCGIGGLRWDDVRPALENLESENLHRVQFEVWALEQDRSTP